MAANFFAYGTLELPELLRALTGKTYQSTPALLREHRRAMLSDCAYPAVTPARAAAVRGRLYLNLDDASWRLVDAFEGDEYERRAVVVVDSRGNPIDAQAYILRPGLRHQLTSQVWDMRRFRKHHFARYLAACTELRRAHAVMGRKKR
jgi:gamma-glutamylcyclotransferase (GGCT)/AIG2-like uncharacterized protein YtfP